MSTAVQIGFSDDLTLDLSFGELEPIQRMAGAGFSCVAVSCNN